MVCNHPSVSWTFDVKDIEAWATTLREISNNVPPAHRPVVREIVHSFEAMLIRHQRQHEEVVTDAPTIEDLIAYLATYALHV